MLFLRNSFAVMRWRFGRDLFSRVRDRGKLEMADMFSRKLRSEIMSRVKGHGNAATELRLIEIFRSEGIHGWRRRSRVFGKPDFVFPKSRLAVFVDGCFWHGCLIHGGIPTSNAAFWSKKIRANMIRDKVVRRHLKRTGWRVLRIWQHDLRNTNHVARRVRRALGISNSPC